MVSLTLYFFSFLLTYLGFLLGNSTKEEHKEVKKSVLVIVDLLKILFFVLMIILFVKFVVIIVVIIGLAIGYIVFNLMKKKDLLSFNDILTFSLSFIFLSSYDKNLSVILILMFALIFENSFKKFKLKDEIYSLVLYVLIYASYFLLSNWF